MSYWVTIFIHRLISVSICFKMTTHQSQQCIIDQQQAQIEKLLKRFNELNKDHQSLLQLHQTDKRSSFVFGNFGKAIKEQIKNIKTPRASTFKTILSNNSSDDSSEQSFPDTQSDKITHSEDKSVQTLTKISKSISLQTEEHTQSNQQLVDEIIELKTKYMQLNQLYDHVLSKQSEYCHTLEVRDGQLKDIAIQRNKMRKEMEKLTTKNESLLQVLEMKSKLMLDPDIRHKTSIIIDQGNHTPSAQSVELSNDDHSSLTSESPVGFKSMTKSLLFSLSPVQIMFKPKKNIDITVKKESVNLANKLMKVIQDKDDIINGLQAQIKCDAH